MNIKKILFIICIIANHFINSAKAQAPQSFNYQAVARDVSGAVLSNQAVSFRISLLQGSAAGTSSYTETHSVTTNPLGLVNFAIGGGTVVSGNFATINWAQGPYFAQVELDAANNGTYVVMSTTQLLSVPYAQYAEKSGNPTLHAGSGIAIQNDSIVNTGDVSNTNEIQTLQLINDTLKLSQTNGGIPVNNIVSQIPSGGYLETSSSVAPAGYTFTGKIEAENCNQLIKLNSYIDNSFQDTLNFNSFAPNYSFITLGDDIYGAACYLSGTQIVNKFIRYNIPSNTWSVLPSFIKKRRLFSMISLNNKIYIIGGDSNIVQQNTFNPVPYIEEYDIAANTWTIKANMPTSRSLLIANTINNKIYVMGGATSFTSQWNYVNSNEVFDPSTNSWIQKAPIPSAYSVFYEGASSNTNIYVKCYTDFSQNILKILDYNISTDSWFTIQLPSNEFGPTPYNYGGGLNYLNNKLLVNFSDQSNSLFEYDSQTNTWSRKFETELSADYLTNETNLTVLVGYVTTYKVCNIYSTNNGNLLCKTILPYGNLFSLKGSGCIYTIYDRGTNKIGLYKYEFPNLLYKYVKN